MAISSTYKKNTAKVIGVKHGQTPAFRAQGQGWFNKLPHFPATAANANAAMTNRAAADNSPSRKIYLFVNSVQTGWSLSGSTGQGAMGRVFYPRNLTQDEFVVEGIVANQYEYDRIVQFVEFHHRTQMLPQTAVPQNLTGDSFYSGVEFLLFKPQGQHSLDMFKPLRYLTVITDIAAGHERFKNFPIYSLQCKVLYDYLGTNIEVDQQINKIVSRQQIFGNAANPPASTGKNPPPQSKASAQ